MAVPPPALPALLAQPGIHRMQRPMTDEEDLLDPSPKRIKRELVLPEMVPDLLTGAKVGSLDTRPEVLKQLEKDQEEFARQDLANWEAAGKRILGESNYAAYMSHNQPEGEGTTNPNRARDLANFLEHNPTSFIMWDPIADRVWVRNGPPGKLGRIIVLRRPLDAYEKSSASLAANGYTSAVSALAGILTWLKARPYRKSDMEQTVADAGDLVHNKNNPPSKYGIPIPDGKTEFYNEWLDEWYYVSKKQAGPDTLTYKPPTDSTATTAQTPDKPSVTESEIKPEDKSTATTESTTTTKEPKEKAKQVLVSQPSSMTETTRNKKSKRKYQAVPLFY